MRLTVSTPAGWTDAVLADFGAFLRDHAACERKASASAMAFVAHYPDRRELVADCIALAEEELSHFREVWRLLDGRGLTIGPDVKSVYMERLGRAFRKGSDVYFLDRLLCAGIAEARGCERFGLIGAALPPGPERDFYRALARAEVRHQELYVRLARTYFAPEAVEARMAELLAAEGTIVAELPLRPALY